MCLCDSRVDRYDLKPDDVLTHEAPRDMPRGSRIDPDAPGPLPLYVDAPPDVAPEAPKAALMRLNQWRCVFVHLQNQSLRLNPAGHITLAPTTCALPAERIQAHRETNRAHITLAPTTFAIAVGKVWAPHMSHGAHITLAPITYALC